MNRINIRLEKLSDLSTNTFVERGHDFLTLRIQLSIASCFGPYQYTYMEQTALGSLARTSLQIS